MGDIDPFVDQGKELASSLRALGVKVVSRFLKIKDFGMNINLNFQLKKLEKPLKV